MTQKMNKFKSLIEILKNKNHLMIDIEIENKAKKILSKDFTLLHIEELTFEDDSPRKEALENVISSLRIDGINFVYLLLGNESAVSFYFGIVKDKNHTKELELDVDDIGQYILKANIEGNFRGSKIVEQKLKEKDGILQNIRNMKRFARIDGVPSVNVDSEDFQGVDRLVDIMMGDEFGLMVLADPLATEEIEEIERSLHDVYNQLSPLAKESVQETVGTSETVGTASGENTSKTYGTNESNSTGTTKGSSVGISITNATNKGSSNGRSTGVNKTTSRTNGTQSDNKSSSTGGSDGTNDGTSLSENKGTSYSKGDNNGTNKSSSITKSDGSSSSTTVGSSETGNKSTTTNQGTTKSREFADKIVNEWMQYIDDVLLKRVEYGKNRGLFNAGIYLFANEKGTLLKLGNAIRSLFSGTEENKAPLELQYITDENEINSIKNLQIPLSKNSFTKKNLKKAHLLHSQYGKKIGSWISTNELSVITGLPRKEVVGLSLKEEVEFGLNIKKQRIKSEDKLLLGNLVRSGSRLNVEVSIDKNHLNKHTFITGVTGSGKTTTCQRILNSANMPFMVIEPAKTEYRVLATQNKDLLIFTLGDDSIAPFRLNPFEFLKGENITSRVDMIKANIEAAFDMEAAIPQLIESALYKCYEEYGWDIATSTNSNYENPFSDGVYAFPTLSDLIKQTEVVVGEQGFDDRLKNDYIGSIKARLQGLLIGSKGFMLNTPRSIDFTDLIERDVILELEEIKNGAEKSLIMGFVLINLDEAIKLKYKEYKKQNREFKHITLIEEAHRLLSKHTPGNNPSKKLGVETFADMLAEVRKYGESLIIVDQIPDKLTPEVLKNTNTKIVHKLFASDDKNAIGNTMALNDEQKAFLSNLEVGRAIISNEDFAKPLQVQIRELENVSTTASKLVDEEDIRNLSLAYYQKHYKRGVIQGLEIYDNEPTFKQIEAFLKNELVKGWEKLSNGAEFDLKAYLEKNELTNKAEFVEAYLFDRFYKNSKEEEKMEIKNSLHHFIVNGKNKFERNEKAYLRSK
jgi:hypothetical protein